MAQETYDDETEMVPADIGEAAFQEHFEQGFATEIEQMIAAALSMAEHTLAQLPRHAD